MHQNFQIRICSCQICVESQWVWTNDRVFNIRASRCFSQFDEALSVLAFFGIGAFRTLQTMLLYKHQNLNIRGWVLFFPAPDHLLLLHMGHGEPAAPGHQGQGPVLWHQGGGGHYVLPGGRKGKVEWSGWQRPGHLMQPVRIFLSLSTREWWVQGW